MENKLEITQQDYRDIQTLINGLYETGQYINELVSNSDKGEHHEFMFDSLNGSVDWLKKLSDNYEKLNK
jgi:hypothetical protein